jgi:hypothetical protein
MAEDKLNREDVTIGMSGNNEVCIITIPLEKYALDEMNGMALVYGKIRELQSHVMQMASQIRLKKFQGNGLIKPPINLKVN